MPTPPQQCDGQQWQECKPSAAADREALARRAFSIEVSPGIHRVFVEEARIGGSGIRGTRIGHSCIDAPSVENARVGKPACIDAAVDAHLVPVESDARVEGDASVDDTTRIGRARIPRADDTRIQERAAALTRHEPAATGDRRPAVAARGSASRSMHKQASPCCFTRQTRPPPGVAW